MSGSKDDTAAVFVNVSAAINIFHSYLWVHTVAQFFSTTVYPAQHSHPAVSLVLAGGLQYR